jgi:hypothetical protein
MSGTLLLFFRNAFLTCIKPEPDEGALSTVFSVGSAGVCISCPKNGRTGKTSAAGRSARPCQGRMRRHAFRPTRYPFDRKGRREDGLPMSRPGMKRPAKSESAKPKIAGREEPQDGTFFRTIVVAPDAAPHAIPSSAVTCALLICVRINT